MYEIKMRLLLPFISKSYKENWLKELENLPKVKLNETNKRLIKSSISFY